MYIYTHNHTKDKYNSEPKNYWNLNDRLFVRKAYIAIHVIQGKVYTFPFVMCCTFALTKNLLNHFSFISTVF